MGYQDCVLIFFFFYQHNQSIIFIHWLFYSKWIFSQALFFSRTLSDFVKFTDISKTWRIILLFSKFSNTCENPVLKLIVLSGKIFKLPTKEITIRYKIVKIKNGCLTSATMVIVFINVFQKYKMSFRMKRILQLYLKLIVSVFLHSCQRTSKVVIVL